MGVQTQFSWGPPPRADRGGGAGAGAQLREAAGGRGEGQASLEGEDLPGGRKGPSPGGALPLGIPHPGRRGVNWVPLSLLLTLEHDPQSGLPAPLLPQGQALSCHLACPQSLRGDADKARAGAQRECKLCTGNYTEECQKTPRPALHHGEAPFRFHMPVRTWRGPSGLPLAAGREQVGAQRHLKQGTYWSPRTYSQSLPRSQPATLSQSPRHPRATGPALDAPQGPRETLLLQTVAKTKNPHLLPHLHPPYSDQCPWSSGPCRWEVGFLHLSWS